MNSKGITTDHEAELAAIKLARAINDPIIVHPAANEDHLGKNHVILTDIQKARLAQLREVPTQERIETATIPEVLLYLYTASFAEQNVNQEFTELYGHALKEYSARWSSDHGLPSDVQGVELTDHQQEKMLTLQQQIKSDRDRYFVSHEYDSLAMKKVPKAFWLRGRSAAIENGDEFSTARWFVE